MRLTKCFLLMLAGMLLLMVSALAENGWVTVSGEEGWVHALPDTVSEILGVPEQGTDFYVFGEEENGGTRWLQVEFQSKWGYIAASEVSEKTENVAETPANPGYDLPSRRESVNSCFGYVSSETVNFRKSPSLSAGRQGLLNQYALCRVLSTEKADETTWYEVLYAGKTGWVSGEFFRWLSVAELKKFVSSDKYPNGLKWNNVSETETWNFDSYLPATIDSGNISLKVAINLSENVFDGPAQITSKVTVTNIDTVDLPGAVELFDPSGHKTRDFGDPVLKAGESREWEGIWDVSEEDLAREKLTWRVRYMTYDENGETVQKVLGFSKKISRSEAAAENSAEAPDDENETGSAENAETEGEDDLSDGEASGAEESIPTAEEGTVAGRWGKTNAAGTNVRKTVSLKAKRIAQIKKSGTQVWILGEERAESGEIWYKVQVGKKEGYILSDYVTVLSKAESDKLPPPEK